MPSDRFNGATTMESWKTLTQAADRRDWTIASMGPRRWSRGRVNMSRRRDRQRRRLQWGHDDGVVEEVEDAAESRRERVRCFNGATTMESWKRRSAVRAPDETASLQWGHDDGVVEEACASVHHVLHDWRASMGPRRWSRGRVANARSGAAMLQCFNGATTMESWKSRLDAAQHSRPYSSFNGATTMESWKSREGSDRLDGTASASMGPRRWSRGRGHRRRTMMPLGSQLQWGHDDGVVEEPCGCERHDAWSS